MGEDKKKMPESSKDNSPFLNRMLKLECEKQCYHDCESMCMFAKRMEAVINASQNFIILKDHNFAYQIVNESFCKFIGKTESEIIGKTDFDFFPKEKAKRYRASDLEAVKTRKWTSHEMRVSNSESDWVEETKYPLFDSSGKFIGIYVSLCNIAERKKMEEAIRKSEERLNAIYNNMSAGISILNKNGNYIQTNDTWAKMTGYSREEILKMSLKEMTFSEDIDRSYGHLGEMVKNNTNFYHIEKRYVRKDGSVFWGDASVTPLRDKDGNIEALIGIIIDVSERKEAEMLKEDIDRITKHDLKNPLNGIIGLPSVLAKDNNITDEQRKVLKAIEDAGYQMLKMINLSMDMYKMEKGTYNFIPVKVDLVSVIEHIVSELRSLLRHKQTEIKIFIDNKPASANCNFLVLSEELLCYSMFANLLKNAVEASPPNEKVTVTLDGKKGWRVVKIHNKGAVPESIRGSFFIKYVTMGKKGGAGLGVYSAKLIAKTHGGDIFMETSEERGTEITVKIPAKK